MPRLRITPEEARTRNVLGQLSDKSYQKYGKRLTGSTFGRMFGVGERTGQNRINNLDSITLLELRCYVRTCNPTDAEILEWFGR